jgi:hypothetical protein
MKVGPLPQWHKVSPFHPNQLEWNSRLWLDVSGMITRQNETLFKSSENIAWWIWEEGSARWLHPKSNMALCIVIPNLFLLWCMWVEWVEQEEQEEEKLDERIGWVCTIAFWICIERRRQGHKRAQRLMKEKLWLLQIPKVKRTRLCNHQESPALVTIHECCWWSQHHTKLWSTSSHRINLQNAQTGEFQILLTHQYVINHHIGLCDWITH